jgi:hypothetical protein
LAAICAASNRRTDTTSACQCERQIPDVRGNTHQGLKLHNNVPKGSPNTTGGRMSRKLTPPRFFATSLLAAAVFTTTACG